MNRTYFAACAGLLTFIAPAGAQYNPYYPGGYPAYPRSAGPGIGQGASLSGQAQVLQSYGDVVVQQENARIQREKANQAKIDTKRKAFDEMMYEKANTPSYVETLTKDKQNILTRVMNFPSRGEIDSGYSLNVMLPFLQSLSANGTQGPPIMLPQSAVRELNVSITGSSSIGILRDGGRVDWPLATVGPNQKKLDKMLPAAYDAAGNGSLTPKMMNDIRKELKDLREDMRARLNKDEIDNSSYLDALDFYNSLSQSVDALARPDTRKQISGQYQARGRNVQELVDYMTDKGLKFAPAAPGAENAYQAVHDAFTRYARAATSSAGFQASASPYPKK